MFDKYFLKTIFVKISFILISFLVLNGCGGGGSVTSNVASGGPVSIELIQSRPHGKTNTGIIRSEDNQNSFLEYSLDVNEALKYDGTYSNPNDYEVVSIISESIDSNGVLTLELVIKYNVTGETGNAIIRGYLDAIVMYGVANDGSNETLGPAVGGSKVQYMPIGNYRYEGYAQNMLLYSDGSDIWETGSFTLDADFLNQTAQLLADTGSLSYSDDNIIIDRQNGTFKGTQGRFDMPGTRYHYNTNIYGTFHGQNAESVTGISMGYVNWDDGTTTYT